MKPPPPPPSPIERCGHHRPDGRKGHATYQTIIGRVRQDIELKNVDLVEVEKKKTVALRKSEEIERQREGKVLAQGNREVAELMVIIASTSGSSI